jgi:hypothetical protein
MAQQPFSLVSIVEFPGLPQCPAYRGLQRFGETLGHIAGLVIWQRWIGVWVPKVRKASVD